MALFSHRLGCSSEQQSDQLLLFLTRATKLVGTSAVPPKCDGLGLANPVARFEQRVQLFVGLTSHLVQGPGGQRWLGTAANLLGEIRRPCRGKLLRQLVARGSKAFRRNLVQLLKRGVDRGRLGDGLSLLSRGRSSVGISEEHHRLSGNWKVSGIVTSLTLSQLR